MNFRRRFLRHVRGALAAATLLGLGASAPVVAEPLTYEIDPDHFAIGFAIEHIGYAKVLGLFLKANGHFVYDEDARTLRSGRVVVSADSVFSNHDARDKHVRDDDFLDVKRHPEIVFEATDLQWTGEREGKLAGNLTLLGQTRPVTLEVSLNKAAAYPFGHRKHTLGLSARTTLRRSQWGMNYGVDRGLVGDEVALSFEFEAIRQ